MVMKKVNLLLIFLGFISLEMSAQTIVKAETTDKPVITVVLLDNNAPYISDIKSAARALKLPEGYDLNKIELQYLSAASTPYAIQQKMDDQRVVNQILARSFGRDAQTGRFDLEWMAKKGLYKGTAEELSKAAASKKALDATKKAAIQLINNSYIQVIDIRNVVSMETFYKNEEAENQAVVAEDKKTISPTEKNKNGWRGEMVSYLYRIHPNAIDTLYDKLWIFEGDNAESIAAKKAAFDNGLFDANFVMAVEGVVDATQLNVGQTGAAAVQQTTEELFSKLIHSAIEYSFKELESQYEPFKTYPAVSATCPIAAKIGKKEGLQVDQSYYIVEKVENSKGYVVPQRNAVVRVCQVEDNTDNEKASSKFYQTSGCKVLPGMLLQKRNEIGLGISVGRVFSNEMGGGYLKLEENLAILSHLICKKSNAIHLSQLKLFGSLALDQKDYTNNVGDTLGYSFQRVQLGISKGFYFARYFSIAPFVSMGMESAKITESSNARINTYLLGHGASASASISHNAQLVFTLSNYSLLNKPSGTAVPVGFANRKGITYDLGLRIEL